MDTEIKIKVGIIGGSGLDDPALLTDRKEISMTTPFGDPSDILIEGYISGFKCVLLARHGRKHTIMPTNVNYRANLWAMKELGCTHVVASTACGSLQEQMRPGDIVLLDQFIDRTTKRSQTFYDGQCNSPSGILHLPMDTPFCPHSRQLLNEVCTEMAYRFHPNGTIITIEGPRFSSFAESKAFRMLGGDVINMTTVPEVVLAKELGLCYAVVALVTDYDCWKEGEEAVNVEKVLQVLRNNANKAEEVLKKIVLKIYSKDWSKIIPNMKRNVECNVMLPN